MGLCVSVAHKTKRETCRNNEKRNEAPNGKRREDVILRKMPFKICERCLFFWFFLSLFHQESVNTRKMCHYYNVSIWQWIKIGSLLEVAKERKKWEYMFIHPYAAWDFRWWSNHLLHKHRQTAFFHFLYVYRHLHIRTIHHFCENDRERKKAGHRHSSLEWRQ